MKTYRRGAEDAEPLQRGKGGQVGCEGLSPAPLLPCSPAGVLSLRCKQR